VELAAGHPSGAYNIEPAPRFLENLCTPAVGDFVLLVFFCPTRF
jgi:hypothetical protein